MKEETKQNSNAWNARLFITLFVLEWLLSTLLWLPLLFYISTTLALWDWRILLTNCISCVILAFGNVWIASRLEKRLSSHSSNYDIAIGIAITLGLNLLISIPLSWFQLAIYDLLSGDSFWDWTGEYLNAFGLSFIAAFVTTAWLMIHFSEQSRHQAEDNLKRERELADAKIRILTNQINPHFLFNNISVGIGLISTSPDEATEYFSIMAALYRNMLENSKEKLIPLSQELDFLNKYIYLLHIRHGNSFKIETISPPTLPADAYIIPGVLQLIFENIFKHNSLSDSDPLPISMEITDDKIAITNLLRPLSQESVSTGIGNDYIKQRYASLGIHVAIRSESNQYIAEIALKKSAVNFD